MVLLPLSFAGLLYVAAATASFELRPQRAQALPVTARGAAAVVLMLSLLSIPWWFPPQHTVWRFAAAATSVWLIFRVWEATAGKPADRGALGCRSSFWVFFFGLGDVHFGGRSAQSARNRGAARMARGGVKLGGVAALLILRSALVLRANSPLEILWCLLAAYWTASGAADFVSGCGMLLTGEHQSEVFRRPFEARSPTDFWGGRWNRTFHNSTRRLIFLPLKRRFSARSAFVVTFLWSALIHEYLVVASGGNQLGYMSVFFALQGAATLLHQVTWRKKRHKTNRYVAIASHIAWMALTSPCFFYPLRPLIPIPSLTGL